MNVNINENVRIKLTEFGMKTFSERFTHDTGMKWTPANMLMPDGTLELPLWEVMQIFGPKLYQGMTEMPFETSIVFSDRARENDETPTLKF